MFAHPHNGTSHWFVIGPFLVVVALLAALGVASADILAAARAYASGESHYTKGQKNAVLHLGRYLDTHQNADYQRYLAAIAVPMGDGVAREALEQAQPDLERARAGFLQGGNHPDDIDGMIRLFQRFRQLDFLAVPIAIWAQGDAHITELHNIAERARELVLSGRGHSAAMAQKRDALPAIDARLNELELQFAAALGDAARAAQGLIVAGTLVLALLLAVAGTVIPLRFLRNQAAIEAALRESSDRWEMAAAAALIGMFEWDPKSDRITLDRRAAALYGHAPPGDGNAHTLTLSEQVHPEDVTRLRANLERALVAPQEMRYRIRHAGDGSLRHLEFNGHLAGDDPQHPRVFGILWDVTQDVSAEQLRLAKETAERANREKTDFLSRVSHELRTPLNSVLGFAQLLEQDAVDPLTPTQLQRVRHLLASGQHLLGLIDEVLDLTRIDQVTVDVADDETDVNQAMAASVRQVEPLAQADGVSVALDVRRGSPATVLADPKRLRQVFVNLLSNAIKYNRPGGQVHVRVALADGHVVVSVRDTGAGLTPAQIGALFQPFNRLGAEHSKVAGIGLGLVIVRQLVDRMGGTLSVTSKPGVGSTFVVRLPGVPARALATSPTSATAEAAALQ